MELLIIPSCKGHYSRVYVWTASKDSPVPLSAECKICSSEVSAYNIEGLTNSEIGQLINNDSAVPIH